MKTATIIFGVFGLILNVRNLIVVGPYEMVLAGLAYSIAGLVIAWRSPS